MKFETYKGTNNALYFRLVADSGKILISSEGYKQKQNVMKGIESVKRTLPLSDGIEKRVTENGLHFFDVKNPNGQIVITSAVFDSPEKRNRWLWKMQNEIAEAKVLETI